MKIKEINKVKIELSKNQVDTLIKVLNDYTKIMIKRSEREFKNGNFRTAQNNLEFINKFVKPVKIELTFSLVKEDKK